MHRALNTEGIAFISLKYGDFEGWRKGRYFCDYTPQKFADTGFEDLGFTLIYQGESRDQRPGRDHERWLNLILAKS